MEQVLTVVLPYSFFVGFHENQKQDRVWPILAIDEDVTHAWANYVCN